MSDDVTSKKEDKKIDPELEKEVDRIIAEQEAEKQPIEGEVVSKETFLKRVSALSSSNQSLQNQVKKLQDQLESRQQDQLEIEGKHSEVIVSLRDKNTAKDAEIEKLNLKLKALQAGINRGLDKELIALISGDTPEEIELKADNLQDLWEQKTKSTILTDAGRGNGLPGKVVVGQTSEDRIIAMKKQRMRR